MKFEFQKARPVWGENLTRTYNQHLGFRTDVVLEKETEICIVLAARTYYRLYINGKRKAHGPARAAKGYCRMDVIRMQASGRVKIAAEVIAYDKDVKYCNDNTMEPGLRECGLYGNGGFSLHGAFVPGAYGGADEPLPGNPGALSPDRKLGSVEDRRLFRLAGAGPCKGKSDLFETAGALYAVSPDPRFRIGAGEDPCSGKREKRGSPSQTGPDDQSLLV